MLSLWALVSSGFDLGSVGRHSCDMMNVEWLAEIIFRGMCTVVFDFCFQLFCSSKNRGRQAGQARASAFVCFCFPTLLPYCVRIALLNTHAWVVS